MKHPGPVLVRLFLVFAISLSELCAVQPYEQPDFHATLFDQTELTLPQKDRIELAWALTSLARNFPDNSTLRPRAKAMALLLSHHFLPYDRDTVVANFYLRHDLKPKPTGHFPKIDDVLAKVDFVLNQKGESEADQILASLLSDLLDEIYDREKGEGKTWRGAVMPPPTKLKRLTADVRVIDSRGEVKTWKASATPISEKETLSLVEYRRGPWRVSDAFVDSLEEPYPYVRKHLQLEVYPPSNTLPMGSHDRELLTRLFIDQFVHGWQWDNSVALLRMGDPLPMDTFAELCEARHERNWKLRNSPLVNTVLTPAIAPEAYSDWMSFNHMHRVYAFQLIKADTFEEIVAWHQPTENVAYHLELYERCLPIIGKRLQSPSQLRSKGQLLKWLREVKNAVPNHLTCEALLAYGALNTVPYGSFQGSIDFLREAESRVMVGRDKYTSSYTKTTCLPTQRHVRRMYKRLHPSTRPLANELAQFIERHAIPFGRVTNKNTRTARRHFSKVQAAMSSWKRRLAQLKPLAAP